MTPLMFKLKKVTPLCLIIVALACFAIAQSARAVTPENGAMGQPSPKPVGHNKWVIPINFTMSLQCAGGTVIVQGDLEVSFKAGENGLVLYHPPLRLTGFKGTAKAGDRKLEAINLKVGRSKSELINGLGVGKLDPVEFKVIGPGLPGGAPLRFSVGYTRILFEFRDGKVTHLKPSTLEVFCD